MLLEFSVILLWFIVIGVIIALIIVYTRHEIPSKNFITFNSGGPYLANSYQFFGVQSIIEDHCTLLMTENGTLSDLYISNFGSFDSSVSYTIRKNSINTSLSVQFSQFQLKGHNTTDIVSFVKDDLISLLFSGTSTGVSGVMTFTINT
jgi:hypothetical protein